LRRLPGNLSPPAEVIGGGEPKSDVEWGYDAPRSTSVDNVANAARFLDVTVFASIAEHCPARRHPNFSSRRTVAPWPDTRRANPVPPNGGLAQRLPQVVWKLFA
jgi:hypothetical protein